VRIRRRLVGQEDDRLLTLLLGENLAVSTYWAASRSGCNGNQSSSPRMPLLNSRMGS